MGQWHEDNVIKFYQIIFLIIISKVNIIGQQKTSRHLNV